MILRSFFCLTFVCCTATHSLFASAAQRHADVDDDDDAVRQVLEEERTHYGDNFDNPSFDNHEDDDEIMRQKQEKERWQQEQEASRQRDEVDRIRHEREAAFEREVSQMEAAKAKAARTQKKKDAAIVRRILRAAKQNDHYGVLGLRNFEIHISEKRIGFGKFAVRVPAMTLFRIQPKSIRKAYRKLSLTVHPDRNRDGRAHEAFIALENSASILSDEKQRDVYDTEIRLIRQQRRREIFHTAHSAVSGTLQVSKQTIGIVRSALGPFFVPVTILGVLVV